MPGLTLPHLRKDEMTEYVVRRLVTDAAKNVLNGKKVITHNPKTNPMKPMYNPDKADIFTLDKNHQFIPPTVYNPVKPKKRVKIAVAAGSPGGPNNNDKNLKNFIDKAVLNNFLNNNDKNYNKFLN